MKLLIIRHAESVRNVTMRGKVFYKHEEEKAGTPTRRIALTDLGKQQAHTVAEKLLAKVRTGEIAMPDIVLSSGFMRADSTAEIVTKGMGCDLPIKHNHLLRERDPGYGFELTEEEMQVHFPYLRQYWGLEGKWFSTPPGGESLVQVADRASLFLQTISGDARYTNKTVYAFSHGGFMMAMNVVIRSIPCLEVDTNLMNPPNCHIDTYSNEKGYWETVT